jgi:hypothetical protein
MVAGRADLTVCIGAIGSGKSLYAKRRLEKHRGPAMVWDARQEYGMPDTTDNLAELVRLVKGGAKRIGFFPANDPALAWKQFHIFCMAAFARGRLLLLAEELADVTTAGGSPVGWRRCITQGRHAGLSIVAISQRPAKIDKTTIDNASTVRCGRLNVPTARKYMADVLDVPVADITALKPLEWIVKDFNSGTLTRETLKIPRTQAS